MSTYKPGIDDEDEDEVWGGQEQYDKLMDDILNPKYEKFSYNANSDPMYKQYEQAYTRNAKAARENTQAAMQSMSGGYGNSYAGVAAQQSYNQQMDKLNDVIPQLEQQAYQRYSAERDVQRQDNLNALGALNTDRNQWWTEKVYGDAQEKEEENNVISITEDAIESGIYDGTPEGEDALRAKLAIHGLDEDTVETIVGHVINTWTTGNTILERDEAKQEEIEDFVERNLWKFIDKGGEVTDDDVAWMSRLFGDDEIEKIKTLIAEKIKEWQDFSEPIVDELLTWNMYDENGTYILHQADPSLTLENIKQQIMQKYQLSDYEATRVLAAVQFEAMRANAANAGAEAEEEKAEKEENMAAAVDAVLSYNVFDKDGALNGNIASETLIGYLMDEYELTREEAIQVIDDASRKAVIAAGANVDAEAKAQAEGKATLAGMIDGRQILSETTLDAYLDMYNITGAARDELVQLFKKKQDADDDAMLVSEANELALSYYESCKGMSRADIEAILGLATTDENVLNKAADIVEALNAVYAGKEADALVANAAAAIIELGYYTGKNDDAITNALKEVYHLNDEQAADALGIIKAMWDAGASLREEEEETQIENTQSSNYDSFYPKITGEYGIAEEIRNAEDREYLSPEDADSLIKDQQKKAEETWLSSIKTDPLSVPIDEIQEWVLKEDLTETQAENIVNEWYAAVEDMDIYDLFEVQDEYTGEYGLCDYRSAAKIYAALEKMVPNTYDGNRFIESILTPMFDEYIWEMANQGKIALDDIGNLDDAITIFDVLYRKTTDADKRKEIRETALHVAAKLGGKAGLDEMDDILVNLH